MTSTILEYDGTYHNVGNTAPGYLRAAKLPRRTLGDLPRGNERVIVVDDNWSLCATTRRILDGLGYRVEGFSRPLEALAHIERTLDQPTHLVLTDYDMPRMNGYELSQHIQRLSPHSKVILTSAWDEQFIVPNGGPSDWPPFLAKPFTVENLARKLREVLDVPEVLTSHVRGSTSEVTQYDEPLALLREAGAQR